MFERVLSIMTEMNPFMAVSAGIVLVLAGVYLVCLRFFKWTSFRVRIFGIFYGLGQRGMIAMSFLYLRLMFVLTCTVMMTDIKVQHMLMLVLLGLPAGLCSAALTGLLREAVNSALLLAGLLAGNLLVNYMKEIQFDWSIIAVYVLLGMFMILYCLYFMLKDIRSISMGRKETDVQI